MADLPEQVTSNPEVEIFNSVYLEKVNIIKDSSLKGLEDKNDTNPKILNRFDDIVFGVGNTDAFKVLSDEYENRIDSLTKKIDDYVAIAQAALADIQAAIAQDEAARKAAQDAYDAVMDNDAAYTYADTEDGEAYLHTDEQKADAQAAYNAKWIALCWKPGQ